ncbi:MAG TPA: aminotransferase class V-fold PLP-dependent enzyme [Methanocorpusculum sp.]|nr:aminotransferase class V-fold PLP-dependent enzyme [Methanocorpusculum sp.]
MSERPLIYLNNAATSYPKPEEVKEAVLDAISHPVFGSGRTAGTEGTDYISLARERLAELFHADENICFTHNATDSLNILISGFLAKHKGCHVLTTELDHNSVLRPLHEHQQRGDCTYTAVSFDTATGKVSADSLADAVTKDTKLAVISHAGNVLGTAQDIKAITKRLHEDGIFVIADGAQSAGHLPVVVRDFGIDAFVFTDHKGLFGITGTGGFWLADADMIEQTRFGGTGSFSNELTHPKSMPERFECGTQNYVGLAALAAGVSYVQKRGVDSIHEQGLRQSSSIIREFEKTDGIHLLCKSPDVPIISFTIDGIDADDAGFMLSRRFGIVCRTGLHCAPLVHKQMNAGQSSIRLSLSALTTDEECRMAVDAVSEVARASAPLHSA